MTRLLPILLLLLSACSHTPRSAPLEASFAVAGEFAPRSLSQFRGRPLALLFWKPGCRECDDLAQSLQQLNERYSAQGFLPILLTSEPLYLDPNRPPVRGITFLTARIFENDAAAFPKQRPSLLILDREGRLAATLPAGATFDDIEAELKSPLGL